MLDLFHDANFTPIESLQENKNGQPETRSPLTMQDGSQMAVERDRLAKWCHSGNEKDDIIKTLKSRPAEDRITVYVEGLAHMRELEPSPLSWHEF